MEGPGDWEEKLKGLRSTGRWLQDRRGDAEWSRGNVVDHTVITVCGARWELEIPGGTLCKLCDGLTTTLHT